jgi:hypothetical protein
MLPVKSDSAAPKAGSGTPTAGKSTRSHLARKQENKADGKRSRCSLCQRDHFLMLCKDYKRKTAVERKQHIEANSLCLNCLGRHKVSECASKKDCTACGARHHTSIHDAYRETEVAKTSHVAQRPAERQQFFLLLLACA